MFGSLAVVGGDDHHPEVAREVTIRDVHHLGRPRDHSPTVEVQVHGARRGVGPEHAAPDARDVAIFPFGHDDRHLRVEARCRATFSSTVRPTSDASPRETTRPGIDCGAGVGPHRFDLIGPEPQSSHAATAFFSLFFPRIPA